MPHAQQTKTTQRFRVFKIDRFRTPENKVSKSKGKRLMDMLELGTSISDTRTVYVPCFCLLPSVDGRSDPPESATGD